jgi:hypothetical protein
LLFAGLARKALMMAAMGSPTKAIETTGCAPMIAV